MIKVFKQKKINHVVHYTKTIDDLLNILNIGFAPSYCLEQVNSLKLYIPMVSFCNIPIKDVKLYMNYGNYGIGISIDKAIEKKLSPVTYIHENTTFNKSHTRIFNLAKDILYKNPSLVYIEEKNDDLNEISKLTFEILMYIKNIYVEYNGETIVTYNEREWRYIPNLHDSSEKQVITQAHNDFKFLNDEEYKLLNDNKFKTKPHLPYNTLKLDLDEIKYIFVESQNENVLVINELKKIYGVESVINAITGGNLLILNHEILENDF